MAQFVLLFRGGEASDNDLQLIRATPGVRILDHTFRRAMLLEGAPDAVSELAGELNDWLVAEEVVYERPELSPPDPE